MPSYQTFPLAFARMVTDRMQAVYIIGGPFIFSVRGRIAELGVRHRLPTAYPWRAGPEAGGLPYGANPQEAWYRAAVYVDKILKGAKPADLPVGSRRNSRPWCAFGRHPTGRADQLGLGRYPGFGWLQGLEVVIGVVVLLVGLHLRK